MPAAPNMNIKTDTELVKKAREGVMEFLLVSLCCMHELPYLTEGCRKYRVFPLLPNVAA